MSPTPSIVPSFSRMLPASNRSEDTVGMRKERVAVYRKVSETPPIEDKEEIGVDLHKVLLTITCQITY